MILATNLSVQACHFGCRGAAVFGAICAVSRRYFLIRRTNVFRLRTDAHSRINTSGTKTIHASEVSGFTRVSPARDTARDNGAISLENQLACGNGGDLVG